MGMSYFCTMITKEEEKFIDYWEQSRGKNKRWISVLTVGLPLALLMVVTIFANFFSGWYKRAAMIRNSDSSQVMVLMVAAILIVGFVVYFSAKHQWDMNEKRYLEFKQKRDRAANS